MSCPSGTKQVNINGITLCQSPSPPSNLKCLTDISTKLCKNNANNTVICGSESPYLQCDTTVETYTNGKSCLVNTHAIIDIAGKQTVVPVQNWTNCVQQW